MSRKDSVAPQSRGHVEELQIVLEDFPLTQPLTQSPTTTSPPPTPHHHQHQESVTAVTPDYASYPQEAVDNLVASLRHLGFVGARRWLAKGWPLEAVAEIVGEVEEAMTTGTVNNPAGLIRYHMREAYPQIEQGRKR